MPAQSPKRLEKRFISGRGLIQIPQEKSIRRLYLYFSVIRLPRINFTSSKWNPDRSEYAKITYLRSGYILREEVLNFEQQLQTWDRDIVAYNAYSLICMYVTILQYFDYISLSLGVPPLTFESQIYTEPLQDLPDSIKIVCRDDTAITVDVWRYDYDLACVQADSDSPPPPDPPPTPQVPPGTDIADISPPYDGGDDNGDTIPHPGDDVTPPEPPGQGEPCAIITVFFEYDQLDGTTVQSQATIFAPYYSIRIVRNGTPGNDYGETIGIMCAPQSPDRCASGEREEISAGYTSAVPVASEVRFLGIG